MPKRKRPVTVTAKKGILIFTMHDETFRQQLLDYLTGLKLEPQEKENQVGVRPGKHKTKILRYVARLKLPEEKKETVIREKPGKPARESSRTVIRAAAAAAAPPPTYVPTATTVIDNRETKRLEEGLNELKKENQRLIDAEKAAALANKKLMEEVEKRSRDELKLATEQLTKRLEETKYNESALLASLRAPATAPAQMQRVYPPSPPPRPQRPLLTPQPPRAPAPGAILFSPRGASVVPPAPDPGPPVPDRFDVLPPPSGLAPPAPKKKRESADERAAREAKEFLEREGKRAPPSEDAVLAKTVRNGEAEASARGLYDAVLRHEGESQRIREQIDLKVKGAEEMSRLARAATTPAQSDEFIERKKALIAETLALHNKAIQSDNEANRNLSQLRAHNASYRLWGIIGPDGKTWRQVTDELGSRRGQGIDGKDYVTNESQLNTKLKTVPSYVGTFAYDQLKKIPAPTASEPVSAIMNTDTKEGPGQHWVAIRMSANPNTLEIFDSLAELSPLHPKVKAMVAELKGKFDGPPKVLLNRSRDQRANSSTCGYFATKFLLDRNKKKSFKEASHAGESIMQAEAEVRKLKL